MPEHICESPITPVCIISTLTAIEQIREDQNITVGKVIGTFGPEIMGLILFVGTRQGRSIIKNVAKRVDDLWMKMVVEPDRQRYAHLREKKDV